MDNFGKIPEGYIVNHIDKNSLNNDISNLEIMTSSEHAKMHSLEPHRRKMSQENIKKAQEGAKAWHRSEEGRKWHRAHWKNSLGKYMNQKK